MQPQMKDKIENTKKDFDGIATAPMLKTYFLLFGNCGRDINFNMKRVEGYGISAINFGMLQGLLRCN